MLTLDEKEMEKTKMKILQPSLPTIQTITDLPMNKYQDQPVTCSQDDQTRTYHKQTDWNVADDARGPHLGWSTPTAAINKLRRFEAVVNSINTSVFNSRNSSNDDVCTLNSPVMNKLPQI